MKPFTALLGAAAGSHAADQLALAALPLTAALALGANGATIGLLMAAQSAAWLLVSLPAGAWIDRASRRRLLAGAQAMGMAGALVALIAAEAGMAWLLGLGAFLSASATVIYVLGSVSILPGLVPAADLPRANARIELVRAAVSLAAPGVVGLMAEHASASWGYAAAALGAAVALACVQRLPTDAPRAGGPAPSLFASARAGVVFVLEHGLLRGIFFCAVFWNFAFFALLALWVPFALGPLGLGAAGAGAAQSAYGAGLIAGALAAPLVARRLPPGATMIFGPASSILAAAALLTAPRLGDAIASFGAAATAHFVVGFGPMLWLIAQTTIRQLVTPAALLGRVNAAVQVAIYGVRPLGALAGGTLAATSGFDVAIAAVGLTFALSTVAILLSPCARLRAWPTPV